jgi:hypothetical protein
MRVVLEMDLKGPGSPTDRDPTDAPVDGPYDESLNDLAERWESHVLSPFEAARGGSPTRILQVSSPFLGTTATFSVRLDHYLLDDVMSAYSSFGWDAVEGIRTAQHSPPLTEVETTAVLGTTKLVALMVLRGLSRLEELAAAYAATTWKQSRQVLVEQLDNFRLVGFQRQRPEFATTAMEKNVISLCRNYAEENEEAVRLGKMAADRKVGSYRRKGSGDYLWFELYAAPQRAVLARMEKLVPQVAKECLAASLILGDLPDEVRPGGKLWRARVTVPALIYYRITDLIRDGDDLVSDLSSLAVTTSVVRPRRPNVKARLNVTGGGIEQQVVTQLFRPQTRRVSRVLANPVVLAALDDPGTPMNPVRPGTWVSVVLRQYRQRLLGAMDAQRRADAAWAAFWGTVGRVAAALGLIATLGAFPFVEAAAPAALAVLFSAAAYSAAALSLIALLVHSIMGTLEKAGQASSDARDQLFRLAQRDPDAFHDIGLLVEESAALRRGLALGLLPLLLTMGVSQFRVVAKALDMVGYLDDLDTLFAAEAPADE